MNEVVTIEQPAPGAAKASLMAGSRPRAIVPSDIDQVWRIAGMVMKAALAPRELDSAEKCTIAILHGLEIGLPPMMALQRITVINGRPAVWGDAVPGIALGTNQVEDWSETITGEGDRMVAVCRVKRKGIKTYKEATFSVADAKRADLWDERPKVKRRAKGGGTYEADNDSPWYCYPRRMLTMRARVAFRDLFADAFSGLYIAEELIGKEQPAPGELKDITTPRAAAPPIVPGGELPPVVKKSEPAAAATTAGMVICTGCEAEYETEPGVCEQCGGTDFGRKIAPQAHQSPAEPPAEVEISSSGRPLPPRAKTKQQQPEASAGSSAEAAPADSSQSTPLAGAATLSKDELIASIGKIAKASDCDPWAEQHSEDMEALSDIDRRDVERVFNSKSAALSRSEQQN